MKFQSSFAALAVFLLFFLLGPSTAQGLLINGAGATFPFPLYVKWFYTYQKLHPSIEINYQPIGSGGGMRQFYQGTLDFGATDIPMSDAQVAQMKTILHFPTALGALVFAYHLPHVPDQIQLSEAILTGLFLGKITFWDDPQITQLNPTLSFPHLPIRLIRRSDGSGASAILTDYLSKISLEWKQRVGMGTSVNWPVGVGGKGNQGVADLIEQTPGGIGYLELIFAKAKHMKIAKIENAQKRYIYPSLQSITKAADHSLHQIPSDFRFSLTRALGEDSYPLSAFTYLLIHPSTQTEKQKEILKFLFWAIHEGQETAEALDYAPLPPSLVHLLQDQLNQILFPPTQFPKPPPSSYAPTKKI